VVRRDESNVRAGGKPCRGHRAIYRCTPVGHGAWPATYDFYYLFHGIVQHSLYHGGQIAMLKKAVGEP
jgi:hypothetical protein